ncbi:MAG: hypothetical protein RL747_1601 [Bacteroidota bacterium]
MHFFSVPSTIQRIFSSCIWRKDTPEKIIYLTFDDGPHPRITPWVLSLLASHQAKATFFCVGENVLRYPDVCRAAIAAGHTLGNHTMHHIKGWRTANQRYFQDVDDCESAINEISNSLANVDFTGDSNGQHRTEKKTKLFRPPYGQIKPSQINALHGMGYEVIQWSNLSCDYDAGLDVQKSLQALTKDSKPGSIVVFHDSEKAEKQLQWILPKYLKAMQDRGFQFHAL